MVNNDVLHTYERTSHVISVRHDRGWESIAQAVRVALHTASEKNLKVEWLKYVRFRVGQVDLELSEDSIDTLSIP